MTYSEIVLVNTHAGPLDGIRRDDARVQTLIHSAGQDHHLVKGAGCVHTVQVWNETRRTLKFAVSSELPDEDVMYLNPGAKGREWSPVVKVGGIKTPHDKARWEPAKRGVSHEATCPKGNGHYTDITVKVTTALDDENIEVLSTEEEHVYRFTCTC